MNINNIINGYGNIDLRSGVPKGFTHVPGKRLQPLCRKLGIPFGKALLHLKNTPFGVKPITDGVVIEKKAQKKLLRAIEERASRAKTPEQRAEALKRVQEKIELRLSNEIMNEFPLAPEGEVIEIVKHACEKRSGRVGRTRTKDYHEIAFLAVRAHIRHNHTAYDRILREELQYLDRYDYEGKQDAKQSARLEVADQINKKCLEWGQKGPGCPWENPAG